MISVLEYKWTPMRVFTTFGTFDATTMFRCDDTIVFCNVAKDEIPDTDEYIRVYPKSIKRIKIKENKTKRKPHSRGKEDN